MAEAVKRLCPNNWAIGIDTFTGHPETDGHEDHPVGHYNNVRLWRLSNHLINECDLPVLFIEGRVEDISIDGYLKERITPLSLIHIDVDLYAPTRYCCQHIFPLLQTGGVAVFDDFGHPSCEGATRAIKESFKPEQIRQEGKYGCWVVRE